MSEELPKEDRTLMSFFNAFHAIGSINNLRPHDNLGAAIETIVEEALMRLQVMKPRNCDVGTTQEQIKRFNAFCNKFEECKSCPFSIFRSTAECAIHWSQTECKHEGSAK